MVKIRAASDVGGTFTDLVYFNIDEQTGEVRSVEAEKAHTTPPNFEKGVADAFSKAGVSLADVEFFAHGTTVVINALTERKGVKTGLITTQGFRDILEIARGNRPDFFNLKYQKPEPFIPRYLRREIAGRMNYKGEVVKPLDLSGIDPILEDFRNEGVETIAVCLLHSYANPIHEIEIAEHIREIWPEVSVVASHEISREWREYERTNTAAVCAYVQPTTEQYLGKLETRLEENAFKGVFYVMQSNGGIDTVTATKRTPISIVESGPASGVLGAAALGEALGMKNLIAFDIGGTTAKCSLIDNGEVAVTSQYMIERSEKSAGYPIMTPVVDIVEIGNGGGSIGWVDEHGKMHVGPQSAGAAPGPVAYGKGGVEPTTTDANLMLRRINPHYFIGGEIEADMAAVEAAFAKLGARLGLSAQEAARGVIRIANNNMTNALKLVSINRGYDPRDFTMVAFGGGGAMHATALAAELNIPKVIIPAHSAVFSAWGMLMSDLRRDYIRTQPCLFVPSTAQAVSDTFKEMEREAIAAYEAEGIARERVRLERALSMRYQGQEHSVRVPVAEGGLTEAGVAAVIEDFKAAYEREYTYRLDNAIEVVNFSIVAYAAVDRPALAVIDEGPDADAALKGSRRVDFDRDGVLDAAIYDRSRLGRGAAISGPAIIEEAGSTTVVFPGQRVTVDDYGNLHVEI
ncbi:MAG: 5-oxoprolinase [Parvularcula sp.]|nr:5-oxoprolinase [Parvularcula sp.]